MSSSRYALFNLESLTGFLLLILVAISSLIAVTSYLGILWVKQKPEARSRSRKLAWRIRGIPATTSKENLQEQLDYAAQRLPERSSRENVDVHSLARISENHLC